MITKNPMQLKAFINQEQSGRKAYLGAARHAELYA